MKLGVTAVELLPIHALADDRFLLERGLRNYWRYSTLDFFAPELQRQSFRIAHWRIASSETNDRRFFDTNALAGVRVEDPTIWCSHIFLTPPMLNEVSIRRQLSVVL